MGKRSNFERVPRDFYPTPRAAVSPLVEHLPDHFTFTEPCAGDGRLIDHLKEVGGFCADAYDIEPRREDVRKKDYTEVVPRGDLVITNPPWDRKILHPMITHFVLEREKPTWLLFDADWAHTKQSVEFTPYLKKIVSIGRVKWIEGSSSVGKDNCCWYLFDKSENNGIMFFGR